MRPPHSGHPAPHNPPHHNPHHPPHHGPVNPTIPVCPSSNPKVPINFLTNIAKNIPFVPLAPSAPTTVPTVSEPSGSDQSMFRDTFAEILNVYDKVYLKQKPMHTNDKSWYGNAFFGTAKSCSRFYKSHGLCFLFDQLSSRVIASMASRQSIPDKLMKVLVRLVSGNFDASFRMLTDISIDDDLIVFFQDVPRKENYDGADLSHCPDVTKAMLNAVNDIVQRYDRITARAFIKSVVDEIRSNVISAIVNQYIRDPRSLTRDEIHSICFNATDVNPLVSQEARKLYECARRNNIDVSSLASSFFKGNIESLKRVREGEDLSSLWANLMNDGFNCAEIGRLQNVDLDLLVSYVLNPILTDKEKYAGVNALTLFSLHPSCPHLSRFSINAFMALFEYPNASSYLKLNVTNLLLIQCAKTPNVPVALVDFIRDIVIHTAHSNRWNADIVNICQQITSGSNSSSCPAPSSPHNPYPSPHHGPGSNASPYAPPPATSGGSYPSFTY